MANDSSSEIAKSHAADTRQDSANSPTAAALGGNNASKQNSNNSKAGTRAAKHDYFDWVNLLVLVLTFLAAGGASFEAKRLADGTDKLIIDGENTTAAQAKLTRDIMQIDQRAWLGVESLDPVPPFPTVGQTFGVKGVIKNTGKTPAFHITMYSVIQPVIEGVSPDFSYIGIKSVDGGMIPPSGKAFIPLTVLRNAAGTIEIPFTQDQVTKFNLKVFSIYAHGRIEYDDIFGNHHWMTYCSYLPVPTIGGFAFCGEHNETDDNQKTK